MAGSVNRNKTLALSGSIWYRLDMRHKSLSDEIREAVAASGMSRYAIAKALGIAESTMSRFVHGQNGLSMEYLDRLAELLGMHIVVRPKQEQRGK